MEEATCIDCDLTKVHTIDWNQNGVPIRSMDFARWYTPSQPFTVKHVSYPQLTSTVIFMKQVIFQMSVEFLVPACTKSMTCLWKSKKQTSKVHNPQQILWHLESNLSHAVIPVHYSFGVSLPSSHSSSQIDDMFFSNNPLWQKTGNIFRNTGQGDSKKSLCWYISHLL